MVTLGKSNSCIVIDIEASTLRAAINKGFRYVDQRKKDLEKQGRDYSHLCGLSVIPKDTKKIS